MSCKFPNWQNFCTIHFLPILLYPIKKIKVQEIFSTVGQLCPGSSDFFLIHLSSDPRRPVAGEAPAKERCLQGSHSPSASACAVRRQLTLATVQWSPSKTMSPSPLFSKWCPFLSWSKSRLEKLCCPDFQMSVEGHWVCHCSLNSTGDKLRAFPTLGKSSIYHCTTCPALDFCFQMSLS